jgi:hypothetical protein
VIAGEFGGAAVAGIRGAANGFAAPAGLGATWNQGSYTWNYVTVGSASNYGHRPAGGYANQYLAWVFQDSSQVGSPERYGWIEVSLSINNVTVPAGGSGPNVTIWGYAYDDSGAKPLMGQVPEPTSLSLLALGAMALGSRGLRQWRRHRDTIAKA